MTALRIYSLLLRRWLPRLFVVLLALGIAPLAQAAASTDCSQMMHDLDAKKLKGKVIADAQQQLVDLGYHPDGIDGVLGSRTRLALALFCADVEYAVRDDLLDTLHTHVELGNKRPDWRRVLASHQFEQWMREQQNMSEIQNVRSGGSSGQVIAVLDHFAARPTSAVQPRTNEDAAISYTLTTDDFAALRSRQQVLDLFGKLLTETYFGQSAFEAAAADAMKGVPDYQHYVELAESYGQQQTGYRLSAESFKQLKAVNVPDYVLQSIQKIQNVSFEGGGLAAAVTKALDKLAERAIKFQPELVQLAEITPDGASLTEASLADFADEQQDDPVAAAIQPRLEKLMGVRYKNDRALVRAMNNVLREVSDEIEGSRAAILDHAELASGYGFGIVQIQQIRKELEREIVPAPCLDMIASIEGADYPEPGLFDKAVHARLKMTGTNNIYRLATFEEVDKLGAVQTIMPGKLMLDKKVFDGLKKKVPAVVIDGLSKLADQQFSSEDALREAVGKAINNIGEQLDDQYGGFAEQLAAQARKVHPWKPGIPIEWDGHACSCVRDNLAGQVYGFYPYWLAGGKQAIDFSTLSRIDYFGLDFNDKGEVLQKERWNNAPPGFIETARKYGSKVDLVIYRNDWDSWLALSQEKKQEAFKKLATEIKQMLTIRLNDALSRAKPYFSLGTHPPPIRGDGVTLYFDGYPGDPASVDAFNVFIRNLGGMLGKTGHRFAVNLMFRSSHIGSGIYGYGRLLEHMARVRASGQQLGGKLLILLEEPTTVDKKQLREKIEENLHGRDRMRLLKDVAMVTSYDGVSRKQLIDDVIYANDNFGGVGFWPQPVADKDNSAAETHISEELHNNYLVKGGLTSDLSICRYICPNRWVFRLAWDISALLMLAAGLLYTYNCTWRTRFESNFIRTIVLLVVPFIALTFSLLTCDPSWKSLAGDYILPISMIALMIGYSIWNYREKKRKANLP